MTKIHIDSTIYTTKPADSRLSKEMAVYDLLEELDIPYSRIDHDVTASIEDCHNVERLLGITICKNLFLCNSQKTDFYLLMMPGDKKFKTKELSSQIQSSRLSFAPAEYMEKYLNITPGSVSVMGLMNDAEHNVKLLIDEDVIKGEYVGCHPCINTSSLKIETKYIIDKFLPHTGHLPTYVKLTGE
ncbi:prolyl-tRNA synthetase associated domain-containing protein [Clostridium coskatii]|uniref:Prolyl-tRNA editing protein ProX n=1 Tax=Clostridium coskatii TaxID=1705578 RepID=A0A162LFF0_9CLOT|nr:prolyl-tRNA synthetase associated domain-containing protein [Clostridium coskatii]OAA95112.1 Prolyl-tRNA editing protein ProX [Clostridium coskatii]OBR97540.1 prolyl-tRNA editing protein ProX [Clostridium coskatii]